MEEQVQAVDKDLQKEHQQKSTKSFLKWVKW